MSTDHFVLLQMEKCTTPNRFLKGDVVGSFTSPQLLTPLSQSCDTACTNTHKHAQTFCFWKQGHDERRRCWPELGDFSLFLENALNQVKRSLLSFEPGQCSGLDLRRFGPSTLIHKALTGLKPV